MKKLAPTFILILLTTSVFAQKKMTQKVIDEYGTKIFEAPKEQIFSLVKKVLESNNYEIDYENLEKGKIITKKKVIGESGFAGVGTAQFRTNYRQYTAVFESLSPNRTKVVLIPKIWIGEADVSEDRIWVLKGSAGEIKLWQNIFNNIQERL
ncbi:hypothetical protein E0W68_08210 [Flavobacterium salilacus subsp. salilacus]|uniref:hypothetical protein n=1 Tax=Flavobacterium TaxID=237 RepID=UPI001074BE1F|nr:MULTISPECIES: hypothetical protein [Flavobacterium]KAF2518727.1 hypothetical protein E0W68_08210 [Flavobacterium salilacus subsp. salilacus]MBE1613693.1 hypothetical protein [Flavobacterium sp. SaA2.13]